MTLFFKKSNDLGKTWSSLQILYSNSTPTQHNVIGNAAPVQLKQNGRILLPFCRNNFEVWLTYSDDDGLSWISPFQLPNATRSEWKWIGTGPPAALQLTSGRILVPSYHSQVHGDGDIAHSHMIVSDDYGKTWYLGGSLTGDHFSSECQVVEIVPNVILINARGNGPFRLQALSNDGGLTWGNTYEVFDLPESLEGCEGSMIRHPNGLLFFSNPTEMSPVRDNMSLHVSPDNGLSWKPYTILDSGSSAYSALVNLRNGSVSILYERSNDTKLIFEPQSFIYEVVWSP